MKFSKSTLTGGFAMFSMFFGSGNLVFPLIVGSVSQSSYAYAIIGFLITAVCVPFLGLLGIIYFNGDRRAYFSSLGKPVAFLLTFLMLALIGPFGVIPRCVTVAFGGVSLMFSNFSFALFSGLFCLITGALIWKKNRVVDIIGLVLTPFKLGSILLLIIFGLWFGEGNVAPLMLEGQGVLFGATQGYQTMDLVAAFFFACTIYGYLKNRSQGNTTKDLLHMGIQASLVGAFLLSLVYVGFILLGAKFAVTLQGVAPESMLVVIAEKTLGYYAMPVVALTLAVSCLATATVLAALFAEFLQEDISHNKLTRPQSIIITLSIAYSLSLLGFKTICVWLGAILEWIYPFLVIFAIFQIVRKILEHSSFQSKTS
jgi:LIVCS family branched-chain amino acid:cation transporter